jgi:hypothetical protein
VLSFSWSASFPGIDADRRGGQHGGQRGSFWPAS